MHLSILPDFNTKQKLWDILINISSTLFEQPSSSWIIQFSLNHSTSFSYCYYSILLRYFRVQLFLRTIFIETIIRLNSVFRTHHTDVLSPVIYLPCFKTIYFYSRRRHRRLYFSLRHIYYFQSLNSATTRVFNVVC